MIIIETEKSYGTIANWRSPRLTNVSHLKGDHCEVGPVTIDI